MVSGESMFVTFLLNQTLCYVFCSEILPVKFKVKGNIFFLLILTCTLKKDGVGVSENFQVKFTKLKEHLRNYWEKM